MNILNLLFIADFIIDNLINLYGDLGLTIEPNPQSSFNLGIYYLKY
jgi:hypothetical protein